MDYSFTPQVPQNNSDHTSPDLYFAGLQSIQPIVVQILSVADSNSQPLHIELDSAATVSYITLAEVKKCHFCIKPNNQVSHLGDGLTPLKLYREINVVLYRNEHGLRFQALVAQHLHYTAIGPFFSYSWQQWVPC